MLGFDKAKALTAEGRRLKLEGQRNGVESEELKLSKKAQAKLEEFNRGRHAVPQVYPNHALTFKDAKDKYRKAEQAARNVERLRKALDIYSRKPWLTPFDRRNINRMQAAIRVAERVMERHIRKYEKLAGKGYVRRPR